MTAPTGRTYSVRRRWLPWRQRIPVDAELLVTCLAALELVVRTVLTPPVLVLRMLRLMPWEVEVRDVGARPAAALLSSERVLGWGPSRARLRTLARDLERQHIDPAASGFRVVVTRDSVAMGDDAADKTRVLKLDDRTAHPTLGTLVSTLRDQGRWVSTTGSATTWVLRDSDERNRHGRPVAVFVLDTGRRRIDVHPVGDLSSRVARDGRFHLEYLLSQSVERTMQLIAADPGGRRSLREDRQA
ncbi:hypothetical protein [Nocardioides astragali]|uniref:ESX secretion-associated protein EspG n=1 Tax=Nocardioides astragali TaxID=1776736 RepID=A0ABW2NBC7_9ACTN|nr:hypothetical protein [Nocardioides astragali]